MPLTTVSMRADTPTDLQHRVLDRIHHALVATIGVPSADRFQIIRLHQPHEVVFDPDYLDINRENVIFIQITLVSGRDTTRKRKLFNTIAKYLGELGIRPEDLIITLTENSPAGWSFGNGHVQLLDRKETPPARWLRGWT